MEPRMYTDLAEIWHLLSTPDGYEKEAIAFGDILRKAAGKKARNVLELGSGGGNNASFLKEHFEMTLVDRAEGMLEASRKLNPECEHVQGDMRSVRLGREFDAVFVHDAIVYMTTEEELRAAMTTAFVHCRPGGAALFVPDGLQETHKSSTNHGGCDGEGGRSVRYLQWEHEVEPGATTYRIDFAIVVREADGSVTVTHDRHVCGLFPRKDWLRILGEVGFKVKIVPEPYGRDCFLGVRPA